MHQEAAALLEAIRMRVQEDKRAEEVGDALKCDASTSQCKNGGKTRMDNNQGNIFYWGF